MGEIGLRRALGAARRHIAAQSLAESTVLGLVGGVVGASLGTLVIVGVSAARSWTPVLDSALPFGAPLVGGVVACSPACTRRCGRRRWSRWRPRSGT